MRSIISLLALLAASFCIAQRISFEDPQLTFSIKKPKNWEVIDNGYVIKLTPSHQDSTTTFITFTYFEQATPFEESGFDGPQLVIEEDFNQLYEAPLGDKKTKILGRRVTYRSTTILIEQLLVEKRLYAFALNGLDWEIISSCKQASAGDYDRIFSRIARSLRIRKR